jgi:hypothetical protein
MQVDPPAGPSRYSFFQGRGDPTRYRFQNAEEQAGVEILSGAYVQVWNLFYPCNKTLAAAVKAHAGVRTWHRTSCRIPLDGGPRIGDV